MLYLCNSWKDKLIHSHCLYEAFVLTHLEVSVQVNVSNESYAAVFTVCCAPPKCLD